MNGSTLKITFLIFIFFRDFENMGLLAKENMVIMAKKEMLNLLLVPNTRGNIHQT